MNGINSGNKKYKNGFHYGHSQIHGNALFQPYFIYKHRARKPLPMKSVVG